MAADRLELLQNISLLSIYVQLRVSILEIVHFSEGVNVNRRKNTFRINNVSRDHTMLALDRSR